MKDEFYLALKPLMTRESSYQVALLPSIWNEYCSHLSDPLMRVAFTFRWSILNEVWGK
jgi:hypothetical protein